MTKFFSLLSIINAIKSVLELLGLLKKPSQDLEVVRLRDRIMVVQQTGYPPYNPTTEEAGAKIVYLENEDEYVLIRLIIKKMESVSTVEVRSIKTSLIRRLDLPNSKLA